MALGPPNSGCLHLLVYLFMCFIYLLLYLLLYPAVFKNYSQALSWKLLQAMLKNPRGTRAGPQACEACTQGSKEFTGPCSVQALWIHPDMYNMLCSVWAVRLVTGDIRECCAWNQPAWL